MSRIWKQLRLEGRDQSELLEQLKLFFSDHFPTQNVPNQTDVALQEKVLLPQQQ